MSTRSTSGLGRDFDRQFGFLTSAVLRVYMAMFVIATSRRDLERLHDLLPPRAQLLRDDLSALKTWWGTQLKQKNEGPGKRVVSDELVKTTILHLVDTASLCPYYFDRLLVDRPGFCDRYWPDSSAPPWRCIDSWWHPGQIDWSRTDREFGFFCTTLYDRVWEVNCYLFDDRERFAIELVLPSGQLDESLTHTLLSEMPADAMCWSVKWGERQNQLSYIFLVGAHDFLLHICDPSGEPVFLSWVPELVSLFESDFVSTGGSDSEPYRAGVTDGFCDRLTAQLHSLHIPVSAVRRSLAGCERFCAGSDTMSVSDEDRRVLQLLC